MACAFSKRGFYNEHQQYVPKHPDFSLKDSQEFMIPQGLELFHPYKLISMVLNNQEVNLEDIEGMKTYDFYVLFLEGGRMFSFTLSKGETPASVHTELPYANKGYFVGKNDGEFETENFVPGEGNGLYVKKSGKVQSEKNRILIYDEGKSHSFRQYEIQDIMIGMDWELDW